MNLVTAPLHERFGVEIRDVDLSQPLAPDVSPALDRMLAIAVLTRAAGIPHTRSTRICCATA